jgi:hypothetical protein
MHLGTWHHTMWTPGTIWSRGRARSWIRFARWQNLVACAGRSNKFGFIWLQLIGYTWSYLACRIGHLDPICGMRLPLQQIWFYLGAWLPPPPCGEVLGFGIVIFHPLPSGLRVKVLV